MFKNPLEHGRDELVKMFGAALKNAPADRAPLLAWPMVCGPSVAKKTRAVRFQAGVLMVQVPDRQWRSELEALAGEYVRAMNEMVPKKKVARIEFAVEGEPAKVTSRKSEVRSQK